MKSLLKSASVLAQGTIAAKLIGFSVTPILTRLYLPSEFGFAATFMASTLLIAPLLGLRLCIALPLSALNGAALNLYYGAIQLIVLNALLVSILWKTAAAFGLGTGSFITAELAWLFVPLCAAMVCLHELQTYWLIRKKKFALMSKAEVGKAGAGSFAKVLFGSVHPYASGLIAGQMTQIAVGLVVMGRDAPRFTLFHPARITSRRILLQFRRNIGCLVYRTPSDLVLSLSAQMPILYFSWAHSSEVTGQVSLAIMSVSLPVTVLGGAIANAFLGHIAELRRSEPHLVPGVTAQLSILLATVSIPFFATAYFLLPNIFQFAFGSRWSEAGEMASALSVGAFFQLIASPLMRVFDIMKKQHIALILQSLRVVIVAASFLLSYYLALTPLKTLGLYSICVACSYIFAIIAVRQASYS